MTLDFQSLPKEPPSAPRAMTYPTKDELEFSSSFNLLRAFGLFHGDDGDDGDNDIGRAEDSNFTEIELLQGYLIGVSYLCDIEKGGNTVTAAALSNDLELYLAANNDLHPKIQSFISRVVLEELRTDSVESRHKVAERILREAVQRAGKRMEFYFRKLKDIWGKCRVSVEDQFRGTTLISSIQSLTEDQDYYNLTVKCYNARGELLDDLNRAANGREDWKHLIHYIGRLGAHKYHVLKIVSAFSRLKFLREIKRVDFVQSSNRRALTLPESSLDFARLSKKVCDDLEKPQKEREALFLSLMRTYFCNPKPDEPLRENQTISTRVHAELVILNHFRRYRIKFFRNHRYIGCSKPACYFCYHWMVNEGLVPPRCHYKVILECRGPDFSGVSVRIRERMYLKLRQQVAEDLCKTQPEKIPANQFRYQSSNGSRLAPSLTPSILSENSSRL